VRSKANFLFFIRVCGRYMCHTRKGMLSDSYIFKILGFVLFLHKFHMCFTALLLFTVGYCSFSFMYIFFYFWLNSFFLLFFLVWLFRSFALDASLRWTKLVPISIQEVPGSNLARYTDYPDKEIFSTVLAGKCLDRTLNFAVFASFLVLSNSLYNITQ
jgi:hypothetical protein